MSAGSSEVAGSSRTAAPTEVQHVAGAQRAAAVTTEAAQGERGADCRAPCRRRTRRAPAGRCAARAGRSRRAPASARVHRERRPEPRDGRAVARRGHRARRSRHTTASDGESQRRPGRGALEPGRADRVAERCGCRAGTNGRPSARSAVRPRASSRRVPGNSCTVVSCPRRALRRCGVRSECAASVSVSTVPARNSGDAHERAQQLAVGLDAAHVGVGERGATWRRTAAGAIVARAPRSWPATGRRTG